LIKRININCSDRRGLGPLYWASNKGNIKMMDLLINNGANVNSKTREAKATPIYTASFNGHLEGVKLLIKFGAVVNMGNGKNQTPVYVACQKGYMAVVKYLIEDCKADYNLTADRGDHPIHIASRHGHLDIVEYLLSKGVDINCHNINGWTSLHNASYHGCVSVVDLLLEHGANADKATERLAKPADLVRDSPNIKDRSIKDELLVLLSPEDRINREEMKILKHKQKLLEERLTLEMARLSSHSTESWIQFQISIHRS